MYAVIETGGKQYRVEVGTELEVEKLDVEPGASVTIDRVLLVADGDEASIGRPLVADAAVEAEVVRQGRGEKLLVFKYRPKARRRVKKGHRQDLTVLRITDVRLNGKSAAETVRKAQEAARTERQRLEEAAARQAAADAELAARLAKKSDAAPEAAAEQTEPARSKATAESTEAEPAAPKRPRAKKAEAAEPAESTQSDEGETTNSTEEPASAESPEAATGEAEQTTTDAPKRSRTKKSE